MNRTRQQFCKRGHDTFLHGRRTNRACAVCAREATYRSFKSNPEKWKRWRRRWNKINPDKVANQKWRDQGILNGTGQLFTMADFTRLFDEQNGRCKICSLHQDDHKRALFVDHCHSTGVARGLLCNSCNKMLGDAKDRVDILENAVQYLREHSEIRAVHEPRNV